MKPTFRLILFLLLLFCSFTSTHAASYYFSSSSGNDSRSNSEAQNMNTPWKSIDKLNAVLSNLQPGDNIYFRRGDTFHGTINISRAGAPGNPIRFGAYGSGSAPIITSLITISNWTSVGNGIFETTLSTLKSSAVNVVLLNDKVQEMGRFPNSDAPERGYLTYESTSGSNSISSKSLQSSPNWTGAEVVLRKIFWIIDRHRISSHSGGTINFENNRETSYTPRAGYGFFIQNHIQTLDKFGEWFFNRNNKKFSFFFGGNNPSNSKVEVSTHDYLVSNSTSVRDVIFENIHFKGANKDLFSLSAGNNLTIQNCVFEYAGESGLTLNEMGDSRMINSRVSHVNNIGVDLRYSQNFTLRNNTIENIYLIPGLGLSGDNKGMGVFAAGHNSLVENNKILRSGYIGIRFAGNNTVIKDNFIDRFCLTKNDGGGIYSYGNRWVKNHGRKLINNIILNGEGVKEGTNISLPLSKPQAEGIYLDDNVSGVEVSGNTIAHITSKGIYLHNTDNIILRNNTVYDSNHLIFLRNDNMGNALANTLIEQNNLLIDSPFQNFVQVHTIYNDVQKLAVFNNNSYSAPFFDEYRFMVKYNAGSSSEVNQVFNLALWQSSYGMDRNSSILRKKINLYEVVKTIGDNKASNGNFNRNTNDYFCANCTMSWDNTGKLNGGSLKAETRRNTQLSTVIGPLSKGKTYRIKFTAIGNKTHHLSLYFRHSGTPFSTISATKNVEITSGKQEYEVFLQPIETVDNSRLMITTPDPQNFHFWLDDLEIHEVEVNTRTPQDFLIFNYNDSGQKSGVPLAGQFIDLKSKTFTGTVDIAPFSSILLLKNSDGPIDPISKPNVSLNVTPNNSQLFEGDKIQLTINSSLPNDLISGVEFFRDGNSVGKSNTSPFSFELANIPAGTYNLTAKLTSKDNQTALSEPQKINVQNKIVDLGKAEGFSLYLNVGSPESASLSGLTFEGENSSNNFHRNSRTFNIDDPSLNDLFTTERFGTQMSFSIPVPNGTYIVRTLHNELWFGKNGPSATNGQRVYDIILEGKTVKSQFDLFAENRNNPTVLTFDKIEVIDGILNLNFGPVKDNPSISGIAIDHVDNRITQLSPGSISPSPSQPIQSPNLKAIYLNAGSDNPVTYQNNQFIGDEPTGYQSPSRINFNPEVPVENLFKTERFSRNFGYAIPIENGLYTIITYHHELWFGINGPSAAPGRRVFDIIIEGNKVKDDFDIFRENGNRPTALTFENILISDGVLNIAFSASRDNATISGVAIIPAGQPVPSPPRVETPIANPVFINVGSFNGTTYQNVQFNADNNLEYIDLRSKMNINNSSSTIDLFRTERFLDKLSYSIPVANGEYEVYTFHNELWFGKGGPSAAPGRRVFSIYLEDKLVKANFDIFIENSNRETTLKFSEVIVQDGILNLDLVASQNNATLSGIAIIPKGSNTGYNLRTFNEEKVSFDGLLEERRNLANLNFNLYPNPASFRTVLEVSEDISIATIGIYSTNGQLITMIRTPQGPEKTKRFLIPIENLKDGVYILNLTTDTNETKKMKLIVKQ